MKNDIKKIVIMRTDRIGEVLLSTVIVDVVKNHFSDVNISFVTSKYSADIVNDREDIAEIIVADTSGKNMWLIKGMHLARELSKNKFDAAIILNPHKMLHFASFIAGIPLRLGYKRKWGFLLNRTIKDERDQGRKHETEYAMDMVRSIGINCKAPRPRLVVSQKSEKNINNLLGEKGINLNRPLISVHPGSSNPAKIWPYKRYAKLIGRLKTELDCNVAILGTEKEKGLTDKIVQLATSEIIDLTGQFNLKELAAFLKISTLFIGNDAGPMHMAAALDVPVIAIFGRNIPGVSPVRWRPVGKKNIVFHEVPGCNPCKDQSCPFDYRCLQSITVKAVFNAAKEKLEARI